MSTSRVINRWLNKVYKSIAIFLVLFAVLISGLRLFLPYAHNYREDVQNFINTSNDSNIIIGELSMDWQKLGPSLVVNKVSLLETQSTEIYIDSIKIHLDFWQSIIKGRLITQDVTLEGATVFLNNTSMSSKLSDNDRSLTDSISDIFLDRINRFTLLDSQVVFQTDHIQKTLLISQLDWLNDGDRHRAKGYVIVDGLTSNNIKVLLDVKGDNIDDVDGQLYLQANQLNITPWLDTVFAINNENTHSSINFDGWLTIKKGLPLSLQLALGNNEISWSHQQKNQFFSINTGQVILKSSRDMGNIGVFTSPLSIITNHKVWAPSTFQFNKVGDVIQGYVSDIDVDGMVDVYPLFSSNAEFLQLLEAVNPLGELEQIYYQRQAENTMATAKIKNINTKQYQGIPGVENVFGELIYQNNKINLNLAAKTGVLDFAQHFNKPIPYHLIMADLDVEWQADYWELSSELIELKSEDLSLTAELSVLKEADNATKMSLLVGITDVDAKVAHHYYPELLMGEDLVNYLNGAIVDGKVNQAQILFNGPLAKFPFKDNEGIFSVDAELSDSVFKFDSEWPEIVDFTANLNFTNNSMMITAREGTLEGIPVSGVTAGIKDLSLEQVLRVDALFNKTPPSLVSTLMNKSPLSNTVGNTLKRIVINNPISGDFSLILPLNNTDNAIAKGNIVFDNNRVELATPDMTFKNVKGTLAYNNQKITTSDISLNWRGLPLNLSVNANDKGMFYDTNIYINANWDDNKWLSQIPKELKHYSSGDLIWSGELSLNMYHAGGFSYDLDIQSDLKGVSLNLPSPYEKLSEKTVITRAKVTGQNVNSTINVSMGDDLSFYGELNHETVTFSKAHLNLGENDMFLPTKGFHITTHLTYADVSEWQPLIQDIISSLDSSKSTELAIKKVEPKSESQPLLSIPNHIRGEIKSLKHQDYMLTNILYDLEGTEDAWLLDLNSKEIRSQVILHHDWLSKGVDIKADVINLKKTTLDKGLKNSDSELLTNKANKVKAEERKQQQILNQYLYANLPPIRIHCLSCIIDNIDFGKVNFNIKRSEEGHIQLDNFVASRDKSSINVQGIWKKDQAENSTNISGVLKIDDLEKETEKLGYDPTIKDSGLDSEFTLSWNGSPHEFSVGSLNGQFNARLDDGYLAEVPDQARVFSVLSLQSLVRKLSFDFRDIFSDGMFYSKITGDFQLTNGVMYTDNMFMKGAAGDLEVKGNTDLGRELLDIRMSYKPNVTSSLPALAWIATLNPVAFLAGIALEEVITSKVYYEMNFELTGTMSDPIFKDVNRKTRNISVGKTTPPKVVDEVTMPDRNILPSNSITPGLTEPKNSKQKIDG